jgi:uncharacterized glyoxalase superfamily protein PhnB
VSRSLLLGLVVLISFPTDGSDRGIKDLAGELALPTSTVHRYVRTLHVVGLLEQDRRTRRYRRPASLSHAEAESAIAMTTDVAGGRMLTSGLSEIAHPNIFPTLHYSDASAAIEWLVRAFGFQEHAVYRDDHGVVVHAELRFGAGMIMLGQTREADLAQERRPIPVGASQGIYVVVADPDAHYAHAKQAGAQIVREPTDQDYGGRDYSARDLESNVWSFGTYDPYGAVADAAQEVLKK